MNELVQNIGEINYRNAASRAYYSGYHCALPIANNIGIPADAGGNHASLIAAFEKERKLDYKKIGYMLRQCFQIRVKADYQIDENFELGSAETAIEQIDKIIDLLKKL